MSINTEGEGVEPPRPLGQLFSKQFPSPIGVTFQKYGGDRN
ncbi:MAG: hypothetical protein QXU32_02560 [Nitrososphaerales archaeon]